MAKKIIKIAAMILGCILVACIILEILLEKMYGVSGTSYKRAIPLKENEPYSNVIDSKDSYYNGIYGVEGVFEGLGEYHASIDGNGFIEPSVIYEEPDKTILFLGGSTTECITVAEEMRYPYLVGRMLEDKTGYKINSYNAGVGGGNSHNSIDTLLHKGLEIEPDIAILHHNINDLIILLKYNDYCYTQSGETFDFYYMQTAGTMPSSGSFFSRLSNTIKQWFPAITSRMSALKKSDIATSTNSALKYDEKQVLEKFRTNLEMFIAICEVNDITPVLMTQASRLDETPDALITQLYDACGGYELGIDYDDFFAMWLDMNQVIREVAAEKEVICIDLASKIDNTEENFYDMVHYTDLGSEKAADVIYEQLYDLIR